MIETIATGRSDKEAAYYLNKAYSTFKNTKNKIFDKLGIPHNTSALVAWYYCIKNEVQLPEFIRTWDAKGIMAGIILLAFIPNEMIYQSETYREVRRGREIETICRQSYVSTRSEIRCQYRNTCISFDMTPFTIQRTGSLFIFPFRSVVTCLPTIRPIVWR